MISMSRLQVSQQIECNYEYSIHDLGFLAPHDEQHIHLSTSSASFRHWRMQMQNVPMDNLSCRQPILPGHRQLKANGIKYLPQRSPSAHICGFCINMLLSPHMSVSEIFFTLGSHIRTLATTAARNSTLSIQKLKLRDNLPVSWPRCPEMRGVHHV